MSISVMGFLAGLQVVLVLVDSAVSALRIEKYGPQVELNPLMRALVEKLGTGIGLLVSRVLPGVATVGLTVLMGWKTLLAFWVGATTTLVLFQLMSLRIEASGQVDAGSPPPPTATKQPFGETVKAWLKNLKDKVVALYGKVFGSGN